MLGQRTLRTLASLRSGVAIVALLAVIAVGLVLSGPAGFGPGEQSAEAALVSEVKKLLASDAQAGDLFGYSVAVSGDTAVAGARWEDAAGVAAGAAYVFQELPEQPDPADLYQVRAGLQIDRFASGLDLPVNLALAPDASSDPNSPFLYVSELYGQVRVLTMDGTVSTYAEGLLNFDPFGGIFGPFAEVGVTGIVVEPAGNDVLVSLVYEEDGAVKDRVLRFESSADGMQAVGQQVLIEGMRTGESHQVQSLTIGPDGKLYVNVGDGGNSSSAQDESDLRGKILRLNLDGSIPPDNPTPGSAVFAKGLRNPFGAAWHPEQPWLYASDNGVITGDRVLKVEAGGNYGWCCDLSQNALYLFDRTAVSPTALAFDSDHLLTPPGESHLFLSISGPTYARGPVANGKKILDIKLDASGGVEEITELLHYIGGGRSSVIGLAFGPDGLYFSDLYGETGFDERPVVANIYRVFPEEISATPTPTPTPTITPTPTPKDPSADTDGDTVPNGIDPDDDNDGCPDVEENGPAERDGGRRNPHNPWDYFNPSNDGENRIDDILAVIEHYRVDEGEEGYDAKYDRTYVGPNAWNTGPPDGKMRIDDVINILHQYRHDCGSGIVKPAPTPTP